MKTIAMILIGLIILSCGQTSIGYNDTIINPQLKVVSEMDSIFDSEAVTVEQIKKHRENMVSIASNALVKVKKLEPYKGNETYKNTAIKYFSFIENYFSKTQNIDSVIYKFNSDERIETLTDQEYEDAQNKFDEYIQLEEELLKEQEKFASDFKMQLDK